MVIDNTMDNEIIEHNTNEIAVYDDNLLEQDFDTTRTAFIDLIDKGNQGLDTALEIMRDTEGQPRCVEAFTSLLKTVADINVQFLKLHELKNASETTTNSKSNPAVLNQTANFFSGSTDDLQQMLKSLGKK